MNSANNTLYSVYKDAGFCWPLALSALSLGAIAIVGILMNLSLIWITYRTKWDCPEMTQKIFRNLHGTANILLAIYSFFEILHQQGHSLFVWMAFSGQNFLPYKLAFRICIPALFGVGCIGPLMAFIGLDRLLCVLLPTFTLLMKSKRIRCLYIVSITAFSSMLAAFAVLAKSGIGGGIEPEWMVTGTIGEFPPTGVFGSIQQKIICFLYTLTIGLYVAVAILFKFKTAGTSNSKQQFRRLLRSLLIIIVLNVGGYLCMQIYLIFRINKNDSTTWFGLQSFAVFLNLSSASNAAILYLTSEEYRKAYKQEFGRLTK